MKKGHNMFYPSKNFGLWLILPIAGMVFFYSGWAIQKQRQSIQFLEERLLCDWVMLKKYQNSNFRGVLDIIGGEISTYMMQYKQYPQWQISLFGSGLGNEIYDDLNRYYVMNNVFSSDFNPDKRTELTLRVMDSSDDPIRDAMITIEFCHGFMETAKAHLRTDEEGVSTLSTNTSGTLYGGVFKEGYFMEVFLLEFDESKRTWSLEKIVKLQKMSSDDGL